MKKNWIFLIIVVLLLFVIFFLVRKNEHSELVQVSFSEKVFYWVEIADTPEKMRQGLMYRKSMPKNQGMLFISPYPRIVSMWMKNTYIPLDMVFLDANNKVVCLRENAIPLDDQNIISCPYLAKMVLELNAGEIRDKNIVLGDVLFMK